LLISEAIIVDGLHWQRAIGNMYISPLDVDMIEKVSVHERHIALFRIGLHRIVFVQIKRYYIFEAQAVFAVEAHQLRINTYRGCSRSKTKDCLLTLLLFA